MTADPQQLTTIRVVKVITGTGVRWGIEGPGVPAYFVGYRFTTEQYARDTADYYAALDLDGRS